MAEARVGARTWWARPGLDVRDGRLSIAGRDAESIASERGTPIYVYDLARIAEQAHALHAALSEAGLAPRVRLAMKAQHELEVLRFVRSLGDVGMDVCSPGEVRRALELGWREHEISYTGTNLSERDLDEILIHPDVHLNVDLITQIERVGRRAPGRTIGLRVNPRVGAGAAGTGHTLYSGPRPTKFGIFADQLGEALRAARRHDLIVDTVHLHVGDGYLDDGLQDLEEAVRRVAAMVRMLQDEGSPIVEVNTGGGLGVPERPADRPLDPRRWATILARHLGPLGVAVGTEPGDFLVKECGVHLAEVVTVEDRDGRRFVGLNVGWNAMGERFIYRSLLDLVLCRAADAPAVRDVTISGHINEGDDLFAEDLPLPDVAAGDIVAAINVGSYNASMTSEHCQRPASGSVCFPERM
jgi:diaminopimelate decarboxylase